MAIHGAPSGDSPSRPTHGHELGLVCKQLAWLDAKELRLWSSLLRTTSHAGRLALGPGGLHGDNGSAAIGVAVG